MKYSWISIVFAITVSTLQAEDPVSGIRWEKNLEVARQLSRQQRRPLIGYFTFDACYWCKRLEKACFNDEKVVNLSRKFIWVKVNRDDTPEIPKRLNVFAYPSLLVLGEDFENVYRFQSYQEPPEFIGNLNTALERYALYKNGDDWMIPPQRPTRIVEEGSVQLLKAPSEEVPGGLTVLDGSLWVAQGELFRIDFATGRVSSRYQLPASVGDLCSDGERLFAVTYGWTAGKPIYVIDPQTGEVLREIITVANKKTLSHGAKGIAWSNGRLLVLSGMVGKLFEVDRQTGGIKNELQLEGRWLSGLVAVGSSLFSGGRTHVWEFEATTGRTIRKTPLNYPVRNLGRLGGELLMMEQPIFGFGRRHERIRVWPKTTQIYRWSRQPKSE